MTIRYPDLRGFLKAVTLAAAALTVSQDAAAEWTDVRRPNILLIMADDMNWNGPGCFGGTAPDVTPNIDRLASQGMRFRHAHVTIAVCTPSRSVLLTGRYPHRNGVEGFQRIRVDVPTLPALLRKAGYVCATIGKPLGQQEKFEWSREYVYQGRADEDMWGRDPSIYYRFARTFIKDALASKRPFFLMANSHDPHRPFHGSADELKPSGQGPREVAPPSRSYGPEEVEVPGFLPDLPEIRREIAQYYSSVRRCDDTVGVVLRVLKELGVEDNTLVMFMSDNGMSFPFAKTNCYLHSTRTPWIVRWPGRIKPDHVDEEHLISGIDFMPTILEAGGIKPPEGMDGASLLPILFGGRQPGRDQVFTQFNHIHGRRPYPMRCLQNRRFGYIFNAWSDGSRVYDAEPLSGLTFEAMKQATVDDTRIAARVRMLQHRVVDELYDFRNDPDALHNLIDDPQYREEADRLRGQLLEWMRRTGDPALEAFEGRHSPAALERFMARYKTKAAKEIEALEEYERRTGYRF